MGGIHIVDGSSQSPETTLLFHSDLNPLKNRRMKKSQIGMNLQRIWPDRDHAMMYRTSISSDI